MDRIKSCYGKECTKVKWTRKFKAGYILQREFVGFGMPKGKGVWMTVAYNHCGAYIGDSKTAYRLCAARGILPVLASPKHNTCSIGYSLKDNKWYGWSHRAIFGFGIGDTVKKGDCCATSGFTEEYLKKHPEEDKSLPVGFKAIGVHQTKMMAIAFAQSVS